MAKFHGVIGYGENMETSPGVFEDVIVEYPAYGDVIRNSRTLQEGEKVNNDLSIGNSFSIVADAYAREHFFAMKYIKWAGTYWTVENIVDERPRLILRPGGVYSGPLATPVP